MLKLQVADLALELASSLMFSDQLTLENFMYQINALNPKDEGHHTRKRLGKLLYMTNV